MAKMGVNDKVVGVSDDILSRRLMENARWAGMLSVSWGKGNSLRIDALYEQPCHDDLDSILIQMFSSELEDV